MYKLFKYVALFIVGYGITFTVSAETGEKTYTAGGYMSVVLTSGESGNSSIVAYDVQTLPDNAVVTKIEVEGGTLHYSGGVITNFLTLTSSNYGEPIYIPWTGDGSDILETDELNGTLANALYSISFNATCVAGAVINGIITDQCTKSYQRSKLTIYYEY